MSYRVLQHSAVVLALLVFPRAPAVAGEAPQGTPERAMIRVDLPEEARLTFDGEATASTGAQRVFFSPPLERGRVFCYTVRSELLRGDRPVSVSKEIMVRAGEETRVDLRRGYAPPAGTGLGGAEAAEARQDEPGAVPPGKPRRFDLDRFLKEYDRNKDGHLGRDELPPELRPAFDRLDADGNGRVSRDELERGIAHLQPAHRPSDLVHVLIEMSECDDVCHGEVQRAYDLLRKLDKDKDGKIDPDELKAARAQIIKDRVDYLFKELDKDQDGKISLAEARGMLRQDFAEIDRNKDGFIDRAELTRAATPGTEPAPPADSGPGSKVGPAPEK